MSIKNTGLKLKSRHSPWKIFAFLAFFIGGAFLSSAYAQYSGGDETTGGAQSSIGNDIYGGGAQNNSPYATSGTNGTCGANCTAKVGYDYVTGLGSPQANLLIPKLVAAP